MFGKDTYETSEYPYYWRVFETHDEYFDYYRRLPRLLEAVRHGAVGRGPEEALLPERAEGRARSAADRLAEVADAPADEYDDGVSYPESYHALASRHSRALHRGRRVGRGADAGVPSRAGRQHRRRRRPRRPHRRHRNAAPLDGGHRPPRRADRRGHRPRPLEDDRRRALLGRHVGPARRLPPQLHPARLPVPRDRDGRAEGGVAGAAAAGRACSATPGRRSATGSSTPA